MDEPVMGDVHSVDRGGADKNSKPEMKREGGRTSGSLEKAAKSKDVCVDRLVRVWREKLSAKLAAYSSYTRTRAGLIGRTMMSSSMKKERTRIPFRKETTFASA